MEPMTFKLTYLSTEQLNRLPQYAQQELVRLTNELSAANAKLAAGPEDSDTFADAYSSNPRPLGKGTRIQFGEGDEGMFVAQYVDGELEVTARMNGRNKLAITPRVSNSFTASLVPRNSHG